IGGGGGRTTARTGGLRPRRARRAGAARAPGRAAFVVVRGRPRGALPLFQGAEAHAPPAVRPGTDAEGPAAGARPRGADAVRPPARRRAAPVRARRRALAGGEGRLPIPRGRPTPQRLRRPVAAGGRRGPAED